MMELEKNPFVVAEPQDDSGLVDQMQLSNKLT